MDNKKNKYAGIWVYSYRELHELRVGFSIDVVDGYTVDSIICNQDSLEWGG